MRHFADALVAVVAGLTLMPAIVLLALLVRATTGAPVLFYQRRGGRRSVPFWLVKFRTMTEARDAVGRLLPDERRVTRLGRLLRRTRLDELPELWNIARGEMGLIGPRPLLPETVTGFGEAGDRRGAVRPGLTGWAQVNGNTLLVDDDKLALDLWYVDHRSLRLDLLILLKTLQVVLLGERIGTSELERARDHARSHRRRG